MSKVLLLYFGILLLTVNTSGGQIDSLKVKELLDEAYQLEQINKKQALETYRQAANLGIKIKYWIGAARAINYSGIVHSDYGNNDSAIYYYKKSIPYYQKANFSSGIGSAYINIGNAYQFTGDYQPAIDNYLKGIEIYEQIRDTANLIMSYQNLAALFTDFRIYDKSLKYQNKALEFSKAINDSLSIAYLYNDIGLNLMLADSLSAAYDKFLRAQQLGKLIPSPDLHYYINENLYGYFREQKNIDSALYYLKLAEINSNQTKKPYQQTYIKDGFAKIYLEKQFIDSSRYYVKSAIAMGRRIGAKELLMNSYKTLSELEAVEGNFMDAHKALTNYIKYEDSVTGQKQQEYINRLENLYQVNLKDNEILRQQLEIENAQTELEKSRAQNLLYTIIAILIAAIAFMFWYRARQRKKLSEQTIQTLKHEQELKTIASLIKGEDQERARIARDLHDSVNGSLAALKLQLASVSDKNLNKFESQKLNTSMDLIDTTVDRIRNISHNLAPPALISSGLVEALESYCHKINGSKNLEVIFQNHGEEVVLDKKSEVTLYHIAQELIQNSLKHSGGDEILVQLYCEGSECHLTIEDNGKGYDIGDVRKGMGLNNIMSRVEFLHADINVRSDIGGTTTTVVVNSEKVPQL